MLLTCATQPQPATAVAIGNSNGDEALQISATAASVLNVKKKHTHKKTHRETFSVTRQRATL